MMKKLIGLTLLSCFLPLSIYAFTVIEPVVSVMDHHGFNYNYTESYDIICSGSYFHSIKVTRISQQTHPISGDVFSKYMFESEYFTVDGKSWFVVENFYEVNSDLEELLTERLNRYRDDPDLFKAKFKKCGSQNNDRK